MGKKNIAAKKATIEERKQCLAAIKRGKRLQDVPADLLDREICLAAVRHDGMQLRFVPQDYRDRQMCEAAVENRVLAFQYVPDSVIDYKFAMSAVRRRGSILEFVPERIRNKGLCIAAVRRSGKALKFVPESILDKEICIAAARRCGWLIGEIPDNMRDKDVCMAAAQHNVKIRNASKSPAPESGAEPTPPKDAASWWRKDGSQAIQGGKRGAPIGTMPNKRGESPSMRAKDIRNLPPNALTRDTCLLAVKQDGLALQFVPERFLDRAIILAAVRQNGEALQFVPAKMRARDICFSAVLQNGRALRYAMMREVDNELCAIAIKNDPSAIAYVPHSHWQAVHELVGAITAPAQESHDRAETESFSEIGRLAVAWFTSSMNADNAQRKEAMRMADFRDALVTWHDKDGMLMRNGAVSFVNHEFGRLLDEAKAKIKAH